MRWMAGTALVFVAGAAQAVDLPLPDTATLLQQTDSDAGTYALPSGPAVQGGLPSQSIDGAISRRAWRIADSAPQTLPLFQTLEAALLAQGYVVVFICETGTCGGFDFRRATEVMPAPAMFVDLGDFRFLSARRPDEAVSILVSKSVGALHVQVITARETPLPPPSTAQGTPAALADALDADGRAVLEGVDFASGSTDAIGGTMRWPIWRHGFGPTGRGVRLLSGTRMRRARWRPIRLCRRRVRLPCANA
ncbi:hypothetical protein [Ketogulonicigenium robustum]|uniref:hypothetical protein n=1 Tax=Ketogulonicigenium robustum TaxID=92947 RepID=UPI001F3A4EC2|nr:hypothetical protein [Ketogulonicigenium robustum]